MLSQRSVGGTSVLHLAKGVLIDDSRVASVVKQRRLGSVDFRVTVHNSDSR